MTQITYKLNMSKPQVSSFRITGRKIPRDWNVTYWIQFESGEVFAVDEVLRRMLQGDVADRMIEMSRAHTQPIADFRFKAQSL